MFSTVAVSQGTVVVAGRARAVVIGVGSNTAMGSIRDAMLRTEDVSMKHIFLLICTFSGELSYVISLHSKCIFLFFYVATSMPICTLVHDSIPSCFM